MGLTPHVGGSLLLTLILLAAQGDDCSQEIGIQQCIVTAESGTPLLFGKSIPMTEPAPVMVTAYNLAYYSSLFLLVARMSTSIAASQCADAVWAQPKQKLHSILEGTLPYLRGQAA